MNTYGWICPECLLVNSPDSFRCFNICYSNNKKEICNVCKKEITDNQIDSDYMGIKAHKTCVDKNLKDIGHEELIK